jgi:hypothetical protein
MEVTDIIKSIPPNDNLRLQQALATFFENTPMSDEDRAKMEVINELELQKAMLQFVAENAMLDANIKNSAVQSKQLEAVLAKMQQNQQQASSAPQQISPIIQGGPAPEQAQIMKQQQAPTQPEPQQQQTPVMQGAM